MAYTQADLDRVEAQIAAVERAVRFGERSVDFRSIDELLKQRDVIKASVNSEAVSSSTRCTHASFTKD